MQDDPPPRLQQGHAQNCGTHSDPRVDRDLSRGSGLEFTGAILKTQTVGDVSKRSFGAWTGHVFLCVRSSPLQRQRNCEKFSAVS